MNSAFLRRLTFLGLATAGAMFPLTAVVSSFADAPAKAPEKAPDQSTPAKAAESFFKAAKAGDVAALKKIISPRIQEQMTRRCLCK